MSYVPGFTADASLYRSPAQYRVAAAGAGAQVGGVMPQMAVGTGLTGGQLEWCRAACLYCRYYGLYCWPCYYCAWIIAIGW